MQYSPTTKAFYFDGLSYSSIPGDSVEITADEHSAALEVFNGPPGKSITIAGGRVTISSPDITPFPENDLTSKKGGQK